MKAVRFTIGETQFEADFNRSKTARQILEALPLDASGSYWGGEFYFSVPVQVPYEKDARDIVDPGTVAYWPEGLCLCIFWGPTPASERQECRAASRVNIVGRVRKPEVLAGLRGRRVKVERAG